MDLGLHLSLETLICDQELKAWDAASRTCVEQGQVFDHHQCTSLCHQPQSQTYHCSVQLQQRT